MREWLTVTPVNPRFLRSRHSPPPRARATIRSRETLTLFAQATIRMGCGLPANVKAAGLYCTSPQGRIRVLLPKTRPSCR